MEKRLYRSPDKKLCGVCAGLADYLNIDPTLVRLAVALIAIYTAVLPLLVVYLICALIIPAAPENYYQLYVNNARRLTKGTNKVISGVCSGFAERLGCDPTIIRLVFVLFVLLLGTGVFAYIICAVVMPSPLETASNSDYQQYYQQNPYNQPPYGGNQPPYQGQQNNPNDPNNPNNNPY